MSKIGYVIGIEWLLCTLLLLAAYINAISGFGLTLSCDSANYLSVAQSLSQGNGFNQFDDFPFLNTAPLYPILLIPAYLLGINPLIYAAVLNGIFLLGATTIAVMLFQRFSKPVWFPLGIPALFFPFWVFTLNAVALLSEMAFIFIFLTFIIHYYDASQGKHELKKSAILLAILLLLRFAGFLFVPAILLLLYQHKQHSNKQKLEFLIIAFLPITIWLIRNYIISGSGFGEHQLTEKFSFLAIGENLNELTKMGLQSPLKMIIAILAIVAWLIAAFEIFKKQVESKMINMLQILFYLISSYILLLFFQKNLPINQIPRYISIIWLPITIFWLLLFQVWLLEHVYKKWLVRTISIFILALGLFQIGGVIGKSVIFHFTGTGVYSSKNWENIPMNELQTQISTDAKIISNHPDFIWLQTGIKAKHAQFFNEESNQFKNRTEQANTLIWFYKTDREKIVLPIENYAEKIKSVIYENPAYVIFELDTAK